MKGLTMSKHHTASRMMTPTRITVSSALCMNTPLFDSTDVSVIAFISQL